MTRPGEAAGRPRRRGARPLSPEWQTAAAVVLALLLARCAVGLFTAQWPWQRLNTYNSYSLQACAWLQGRLDLGQDYPWLELAVYGGRYYVSFPPFPSVVLLPFAAALGASTPDGWIALAFSLIAAVHAARIARRLSGRTQLSGETGAEEARAQNRAAVLWACGLLLANGYLFLTLNGWVWFIAQNICFALTLAAIDHALSGRGTASLALWACAVGCRPMMLFLLPVLLALLWRAHAPESPRAFVKRCALWLILPALIGGFYAALNWARFGNPLEFGHNYLPEFQRAEQGQFSLSYAWEHLRQWLLPLPVNGLGVAEIPVADGMPLWLTSPLLLSACAEWIAARVRRDRAAGPLRWMLPAVVALYLFVILCHRTLGGWQFGNRYVVDVMPMLFLGFLLEKREPGRMDSAHLGLMLFGVMVHGVGTAALYAGWV